MSLKGQEQTIHMRIGAMTEYALRRAQLDDLDINVLDVKKPSIDKATGYTKVIVSQFYDRNDDTPENRAKAKAASKQVEAIVKELLGDSVKKVTLKATSRWDRVYEDKDYAVIILVDRKGTEAQALLAE